MNEIWISNNLILVIDFPGISNEIYLSWLLLDLTGKSGNTPLPESMLDQCDHVPY